MIPGLGRSPGEGNNNPFQYSCLENPMDRGAGRVPVPGVAKSRTRLSDFTLTFHFHALEEEMATHSSILAWKKRSSQKRTTVNLQHQDGRGATSKGLSLLMCPSCSLSFPVRALTRTRGNIKGEGLVRVGFPPSEFRDSFLAFDSIKNLPANAGDVGWIGKILWRRK